MAIERWHPFQEMHMLRHVVDDLFHQHDSFMHLAAPERLRMDVYETDDSYCVEAALPGFRPEDIDISVEGNVLCIRAERRQPREVEQPHYLMRERAELFMERIIQLPTEVNADQAQASFENGILTVRLPKAERARPHKIQVSGAGQKKRLQGR